MPAALRITDGNPVWLSQPILPSKDTVVSAGMSPTVAAILVNPQDVFVYVKVDNAGTDDIGPCPVPCQPLAELAVLQRLPSRPADHERDRHERVLRHHFHARAFRRLDQWPGGFNHSFGLSAGQRAWGWSPDGRFFALARASSHNGSEWNLTILALQSTQRPRPAPRRVAFNSNE